MSDNRIRVLVVDDSALMRNIVSRMIEQQSDMVVASRAMNGEFALQKVERDAPDAVVLDIEMPVMNGLQFLQACRDRGITVPVIVLSSVAVKGAAITMEALSLGAVDFLTKPSGSVSYDLHVVAVQLIAMIRSYGGAYRRKRGLSVAPPDQSNNELLDQSDPGVLGKAGTVTQSGGATAPTAAPAPLAREGRTAETVGQPARGRSDRATGETEAVDAPRVTPRARPGKLELIAFGISTGGPNALRTVFAELDANLGVPVVVVQHMPAGFTSEFARSLDRICPLEVKEAAEGDILKPNRILIAPGNYHLTVEKRSLAGIVHVNSDAPRNGHRPSVDALFESVAAGFGNHAMAIIMTGMGRDGAAKIGAVYEAGGVTIGQDEQSSVVYGMPRVAFEYGYLHRQVPLSEMAKTVNTLAAELRR